MQSNSYCVPGTSRVAAMTLYKKRSCDNHVIYMFDTCTVLVIGLEVHESESDDGTWGSHMTVHMISFLQRRNKRQLLIT